MSDRTQLVERIAPWATGLLLAAPVLAAYYPPMTDLPFHEAAIGLLRHFGEPAMVPPGLYVHNLGEPNQLFHMVGWLLAYVTSTRWAVKLLVAAAVAGVPVAAARFARHVGASPLASLLVAPMALGWLFSWGLITNLIGVGVLLAVLPGLDSFAAKPSGVRALRQLGSVMLLYFAHMAMLVVYGGIALGLAVLHPWSRRRTGWRLVPVLAAIAVTLGQLQLQKPFVSEAVGSFPTLWHSPLVKLAAIPNIVLPATDPIVHLAMLALCSLLLGGLFFHRRQQRRRDAVATEPGPARADAHDGAEPASGLERARRWALRYRWELVATVAFAAYMAFPLSLNGATLVYQRWLPPAFAILAVVAAPRTLLSSETRVASFAAFVLPIATLLVAGPSFVDSDRQYRNLEAIIATMDPGAAVAAVDLGPGDPSRTYSLGSAEGRIMAERGGRLVYAFTDSSVSPVVVSRPYQWNESLRRVGVDSWSFMPAHDLKRFRYVLVRARDPRLKWLSAYALAQETRLVHEEGEWALFEAKKPVLPLTSPDEPLPDPRPETIRDRIETLASAFANATSAPSQGR